MKPASFEYERPAHLDEACALLAAGDDVRIIAGGQTLVPLMAMRLARPKRLIDIARIPELAFVRDEGSGVVDRRHHPAMRARARRHRPRQGAAARQGHAVRRPCPDPGARNRRRLARQRGSGGGDRAGRGDARRRRWSIAKAATVADIAAADFFIGPMMTALPAAGCLTAVRFPVWHEARIGVGFHEVNARRSDFAFASAAAQIALDDDGRCRRVALGVGGITPCPLRLDAVADALIGTRAEEAITREAVRAALADIELLSDLHASADYRRRAAATLAVRAITDAYRAAEGAHAR